MMVLTAARPKGRQAAVLLTYEKTDISEEIAPDLESFKYTDVAESKKRQCEHYSQCQSCQMEK